MVLLYLIDVLGLVDNSLQIRLGRRVKDELSRHPNQILKSCIYYASHFTAFKGTGL